MTSYVFRMKRESVPLERNEKGYATNLDKTYTVKMQSTHFIPQSEWNLIRSSKSICSQNRTNDAIWSFGSKCLTSNLEFTCQPPITGYLNV